MQYSCMLFAQSNRSLNPLPGMAKRPVAIREPIVGTVVTGHVGKLAWKASSLHSAVGFLHTHLRFVCNGGKLTCQLSVGIYEHQLVRLRACARPAFDN